MSRRPPAWALAAALAVAYVAVAPPSTDLVAQAFRAHLAEAHGGLGLPVWNGAWYGGHHLPGYSVLAPPLGALAGPRAVGALGVVLLAWAGGRALREAGHDARAEWLLAGGAGAQLLTGRTTFLLGAGVGAVAVLAATRGRPLAACALAVLAALAAPLAGLFLGLLAAGRLLAGRAEAPGRRPTREALALGAAAAAPVLVLAIAFPEGGSQPFPLQSLAAALPAAVVVGLTAHHTGHRTVAAAAAVHAVALVAFAAVPTPVGNNAVRLGSLLAPALVAGLLLPRRPRLAAALLVPLLAWQLHGPVRDLVKAAGDPSLHAAFHAPLVAELERRDRHAGPGRVEVPFTRNHGEADHLARHVPLARGWERQLDRARNGLFYDDAPLTPARLRAWLDANAVRWVALADVPLDEAGEEEAALVRAGRVPGLVPVWRNADWRLYAVRDAAPLAEGARARIAGATADRLELEAPRPGPVRLRVRWSPYWRLEPPAAGCVARTPDDRLRVDVRRPGRLAVAIDPDPARVAARSPRCAN